MSEEQFHGISSPPASVNYPSSRPQLIVATLKRRASPLFEGLQEDSSRKRKKEGMDDDPGAGGGSRSNKAIVDNSSLADDLAQELQCACCSELVYRPVIVAPCQHFFCGSCCMLWIRNGGTNCPACRGASNIATPFRPLQAVIDALLRAAPHKARTERERQQADDIYKAGTSMRIPTPREASPEPNINQSSDFAHPCPHCSLGNPFGWRCPQPIPDPITDPDHAWHLDDGLPPGHAHCGNCENLLATHAPTTTKCDLCQVSFCGIGVQGRCLAAPLLSQHPHGMADVGDLIQSADVYECFDSNTVEVEIMLDYLTSQRLTPRHIYREIVTHIQSQPRGFTPLVELDLFVDVHGVSAGTDSNPDAPRTRACRLCATEVLLWGLREWWVRERQKGFLEEHVVSRKDCPQGSGCGRQKDLAHAREFNHIVVVTRDLDTQAEPILEPEPEPVLPTLAAVLSAEVPATLSAELSHLDAPDDVSDSSIISASATSVVPFTFYISRTANELAPPSTPGAHDTVDALR